MALEKDYLRGPSAKDHAKDAMFQGAVLLAIALATIAGMAYFLGVVWFLPIGVGVVGLFRLLYGLLCYTAGWQ